MSTARRRTLAIVGAVAVVLAVSDAGPALARGPLRFVTVAPGIAHASFEIQPDNTAPFLGHAFNVDLDVVDLRLVPAGAPPSRRTVAEIVAPYTAVVATNASFFDVQGRPMGLAVDEGRVLADGKRRSWGALVIDGRHARIVLGEDIKDDHAHRLVVQGIPRLVVGGKVQPLKPQVAERTAICAKGSVVVLVVATKAETTPFARFLADPPDQGGLGCQEALNLDGGTSTQLVVKLPGLTFSFGGGSGVPNALVLRPRQM